MPITMTRWLSVLALAGLGACASTDKAVGQAAVTPLNDLNLVQAPIPPALQRAQQAPYLVPADQRCAALTAEVRGLDEVLGADLDAPAAAGDAGLIERGGDAGTVRRACLKGLAQARGCTLR